MSVIIGHFYNGVIWLQLTEYVLLSSLECMFVSRMSSSSQKKSTIHVPRQSRGTVANNHLPQSILVVVVK